MIGQLRFCTGARGTAEVERICGLPVLRTQIDPESWLGGRYLRKAGKTLWRQGVVRTLLPREFDNVQWLERWGLRCVDTSPFLQEQSPRLAMELLHRQGVMPERATVALCGVRADRAMARSAVRLCRSVRNLVIAVPEDGNRLADWLRWEYGVAVLPSREQAQLALQFQPVQRSGDVQTLELYGRNPDLAGVRPMAEALPRGEQDDLELLSILWERGKLGDQDLKFT